MMQSIPDSGASNGQSNGSAPGPKSTTESLVDSALDALSEIGGPANDNVARREKRAERDAPDAAEPDEQEEDPLTGDVEEPDAEQEDEAAHEDDVEHDTRGSKEEPFSVKDLPEDKFIELKVDGEKTVVSLKELANGYIREDTFNRRINRTKQLADEAQAHAKQLTETREQLRAATREFLHDPDQLLEYFTDSEEREQVIMQVAQRLAAQVRAHRENPQSRIEYERQRAERKIKAEKERWEAQKQAEARASQEREAQARFEKVFKPGWNEGLKRAGFPDVSGQHGQALWDEVMVRLNQRHQTGKPIEPGDVAEFVYRAAKLLELPPKNAKKPRPAPAPAPREREKSKGRDPWADKPRSKKLSSPDFFLKNLRPKDFRL